MIRWAEGPDALIEHTKSILKGRRPLHWPLAFPDIFAEGGFSALIGNPPYRHGSRVSTDNGTDYLRYLVSQNEDVKGTVDLAVYFLRRAPVLLARNAYLGLVTTKSVSEGENKTSGLGWLFRHRSLVIYNARKLMRWPGKADLLVSVFHGRIGEWAGEYVLDGQVTLRIDEALECSEDQGPISPLEANLELCFKGSELLGEGFILTADEARDLLASQVNAGNIVKPLVNGKEFSTMATFSPDRWVIDFGDMNESEARGYPRAFELVEARVKGERAKDNRPARRDRFWRFGEIAKGLYFQISKCDRVIARLFTGEYWFWDFLEPGPVFTNGLVIVADPGAWRFAVLTSSVHEVWAGLGATSLVTRFRYTPSRCFETFPFPISNQELEAVGEEYREFRRSLMSIHQEGLTRLYSRFHDPLDESRDIQELRRLHRELDNVVIGSYSWTGLHLDHDFKKTKQGYRYTIGESVRSDILKRLFELNAAWHQRESGRIKLNETQKRKSEVQPSMRPPQIQGTGSLFD
jgi:hypothetical protein